MAYFKVTCQIALSIQTAARYVAESSEESMGHLNVR